MQKKSTARRASKKAVEKVLATTPGKPKFSDGQRITIKKEFKDACPKRAGSRQAELWAHYLDSPTVGEFRSRCASPPSSEGTPGTPGAVGIWHPNGKRA